MFKSELNFFFFKKRVPYFFQSGRVKQFSPRRTRSPCLWKLRGRSALNSSVHLSPWLSNSSWRIFSSSFVWVRPLSFLSCKGNWNRTYISSNSYIVCANICTVLINRHGKLKYKHNAFNFIHKTSFQENQVMPTWLSTISQTPSEAALVLRDWRSTWEREAFKSGKYIVSSESLYRHKLVSRNPLDWRNVL